MEDIANAVRGEAHRVLSGRAVPRQGIVTSYDPDAYSVKVTRQPEDSETGWIPISSVWAGNGWGLFAPPVIGSQVELGYQEDGTETAQVKGQYFSDEDLPIVPEIGSAPAGEFWLVHESGTRLRLQNDSTFEIQHRERGRFRMLPDSSIEVVHKDGALLRMLPDASVNLTHKDGSRLYFHPNATVELVHVSGSRIVMHPDGTMEIAQANGSFIHLQADNNVQIRGTTINAGGVGGNTLRLMTEQFVTLYNNHTHGSSGPPVPQMTDGQITKIFRAG